MSAAVSTSRAASRSTRDKLSNRPTTQSTNRHNEGGTSIPKDKYLPTQEQLNIAQITSINNEEEVEKINQLKEMTGKTEDAVAVALLDCDNDVERAVLMLLEGDGDNQGEWKSQGKKKKPKNPTPLPPPPPTKSENTQNHTSEKSEFKRDRSRDRDQETSDRSDGPSRRGRRNGAPPPRFARGRGRDRNFYGGDKNENGEENRENGFDNRDRSGGRGRGRGGFGRGRGRGRGGRGGGSGDFGGEFECGEKPAKFDKGPQIDTWTNETAEIQQKEPAGWGSTWGAEDWSDDTWTGNLNETQVFTSSTARAPDSEPTPPPQNDTSTIGQRLDLGILLQKPTDIQQPKQPSYNMSQYNQQATESIKNCIGIGAPRPQSISNLQSNQSQSLGPVGSISQSVQSNSLPSPSSQQQALQQQRSAKITRSKLPPPSKIPASAVEMPGHRMPMLDVQFGVDFGNEPAALSFGASDSRLPTSVNNSPPSMSNHLPQMNSAPNPGDSMTSTIMSSPSAGSNSTMMSGLDQSSRSASLFQNSAYSSPPKNESQSVLNQTKMTPPEPIPYHTSDRKSSPLVSQRTGQASTNSMGQGSSSQDASNLSSFGQSAGSYQSGGYQGHKTSSLPGSQPYTTNSQSSTYQSPYQTSQNQYQSSSSQYQSSQNQYPTANQTAYQTSQNQYPSGQNQYQSGQSQYPSGQQSYSNYPSGTSFQSQPGYSSNQTNSSSLYQNSSQGSGAYSGPSSAQGSSAYSGQNSTQGSGAYSGQNSTPGSGAYSSQNSSQGSGAYSGQTSAQVGGNYSGQSSSQGSAAYSGQNSTQGSGAYSGQSSSQGSGAYAGQSSSYHMRDSQSSSSNPTNSNQYPSQSPGLSTSPSPNQTGYSAPTTQNQSGYSAQQTQTQSGFNNQSAPTSYSAQSYSSSSTLQTSPLTTSKLGDSLTKMTLKENSIDSVTANQFDSSVSTPSLTATSTPSLSGGSVNTVSSSSIAAAITTTSSRISSISSNSITTSKAPPNLPPGVPLVGTPQYIMSQAGAVPSFYSLQQPMYGYEDQMQLLQQRVPLANNYYDMAAAYQVPSSLSGRDQATLGNVPYSVPSDTSKLNRVDAQSPNPSSQQPTSQSAHQPFIHFNYGYYYPQVLPGTAAGFQIPTMYQMPAVTNTPHASTTATTQFQKTFASHGYGTKAYDELGQVQDYAKTAYGVSPSQTKVSAGTRSAADLAGSSYTKSHSQAFDKQGFHAGTPPPFMPHGTANQTGPMGTPTNPYAAATPFVQMMAPHNQMLHHIQQDSSVSNRLSQQTNSQSKTASKAYGTAYWGAS